MKLERKRSVVAPGRVRHRVVVRGEPCPQGTNEARQHWYIFLRWLAANPDLMACGYSIPAVVRIHHDGGSWVTEAEAEVEEPTEE